MSWENILKKAKYYTEDGKEWTGPKHQMPDGSWMTENPHNEKSVKLNLKKDDRIVVSGSAPDRGVIEKPEFSEIDEQRFRNQG